MKIQSTIAYYDSIYMFENDVYEQHYSEEPHYINPKKVIYFKIKERFKYENVIKETKFETRYMQIWFFRIRIRDKKIKTEKVETKIIPARLLIYFNEKDKLHFAFKTNKQLKEICTKLQTKMDK